MKIFFNKEIPEHSIITNNPETGKQWMFLGEDNEFELIGKEDFYEEGDIKEGMQFYILNHHLKGESERPIKEEKTDVKELLVIKYS